MCFFSNLKKMSTNLLLSWPYWVQSRISACMDFPEADNIIWELGFVTVHEKWRIIKLLVQQTVQQLATCEHEGTLRTWDDDAHHA